MFRWGLLRGFSAVAQVVDRGARGLGRVGQALDRVLLESEPRARVHTRILVGDAHGAHEHVALDEVRALAAAGGVLVIARELLPALSPVQGAALSVVARTADAVALAQAGLRAGCPVVVFGAAGYAPYVHPLRTAMAPWARARHMRVSHAVPLVLVVDAPRWAPVGADAPGLHEWLGVAGAEAHWVDAA